MLLEQASRTMPRPSLWRAVGVVGSSLPVCLSPNVNQKILPIYPSAGCGTMGPHLDESVWYCLQEGEPSYHLNEVAHKHIRTFKLVPKESYTFFS